MASSNDDKRTDKDSPVALITGGAQRIGTLTARSLHQAGCRIVIHYRHSREPARQLQSELNQEREDSVMLVQGDLLQVAKLKNLVDETKIAFGRLDILVNNASSFYPTVVGETDEQQFEDLIGTNLKAPYFLCQAAAPLLRKHRGCVINMTDIYAERPLEEHPVYCAAKAGLVSLTRSLARELAPEVRVNAVAPGAIIWPTQGGNEISRQRIISRTPLKRSGAPSDIANTIRFLALDAPFITGQIINVDGGRTVVP